ncbi:MAG: ATP synthase F1 subunit epsilon [Mycoplasmoidaceae bacterium]|nr:ATP synthase F1 subunit epsilon [Mycoplasmoidaceae bacterium]
MAFSRFKLKINTPEGIFFEDDILQIELKTSTGYIAILANHAPLIGAIVPSVCYIRDIRNNRVSAVINGGMFYTNNNEINVITDFFDFTNNINESVIAKREQKIKQAISNKTFSSEVAIEKIQTKLEKELNDLRKIIK